MKRMLCIALVLVSVLCTLALPSCAKKGENMKLGLGVYSTFGQSKDAEGEKNGQVQITSTVAAVMLDRKNRIVKCEIDCADSAVPFNSTGEFQPTSFMTKDELGYDYNMKKYGAKLEWFEHANAFEELIVGKTLDHIALLITEDGKSGDEIISSGCTIAVGEFIKAVEAAVANAVQTEASYTDTLGLGVYTTATIADSKTAAAYTSTFYAATTNENGKITAITGDRLETACSASADGKSTTNTTAALKTFSELSLKAEEFDAFASACLGKSKAEISALGATHNADMVASALKAMKEE